MCAARARRTFGNTERGVPRCARAEPRERRWIALAALVAAGCGGRAPTRPAASSQPDADRPDDGQRQRRPARTRSSSPRPPSGSPAGRCGSRSRTTWRGGTPGLRDRRDRRRQGRQGRPRRGRARAPSTASDVPSFDALHAPLLIDSYPLQRTALESPLVPARCSSGLEPLGVVGLGILPGPLRKPLGVSRLVRPADYAGKDVRVPALRRSPRQTLRALGARGAEIPSAGAIDGYDGIEQQVASIDNNRYDSGRQVPHGQREPVAAPDRRVHEPRTCSTGSAPSSAAALRGAARAALPRHARESAGGRQGGARRTSAAAASTFVTADAADLAALRRAVQPVYDRLERDAADARPRSSRSARCGPRRVARPDAPTCSGRRARRRSPPGSRHADRRRLPGAHVRSKELLAARVRRDHTRETTGDFEMTLDRGRFTQMQPLGYVRRVRTPWPVTRSR